MTKQAIQSGPNVTDVVALKNRAPRCGLPEPTPGGDVGESLLRWGRVSAARLEYFAIGSRYAVKRGPK